MGVAENMVESSYDFDEKILESVAEDRKERILGLISETKRPNSLEGFQKISEGVHYEIYSLKDSQLSRVLNKLDDDETKELLSLLNESQVDRIKMLSNLEKLVVSPTKTDVSDIIEHKKPAANDDNYNIKAKKNEINTTKIKETKQANPDIAPNNEKKAYKQGFFEEYYQKLDLDRPIYEAFLGVKNSAKNILQKAA